MEWSSLVEQKALAAMPGLFGVIAAKMVILAVNL
jgi:hypothetical protein